MPHIKTEYVRVGAFLRREWVSLLEWAERGGCYVNYRKVPGLTETIYYDVVVEGDRRYIEGIYEWVNTYMDMDGEDW